MFLWHLELFGGLRLTGPRGVYTRFRTKKTGALLALLALQGRAFTREELIETFWPDDPPEAAAHSLRQALSSLRQILGPGLEAPPRGTVSLQRGAISTDVAEFEAALRVARHPATKAPEAAAALQKALQLQKHDLLPEFYDDGIVRERERLKALRDEAERYAARWVPPPMPEPLQRVPAARGPFFGREAECALIDDWWHSGKPLLTITGLGGSGKTRLALQSANRLVGQGVGGVFVPLAELKTPRRMVEALLEALGESTLPNQDPLTTLLAGLQALPGRTLLVLDNLEQLLSQETVGLLRTVLERCPHCSLLVTSRLPLEMEGERELALTTLSEEGALALFAERAGAVFPSFALTDDNRPVLREVCQRLGGIPLALELAAAQLRVLSPQRLLEHLQQHGTLELSARRRDLPERHRYLRLALEWSVDLLSPEARELFLCLTVFRGGWTPETAAAVALAGVAEIQPLLAELLRCSLIVRESEERFGFLVPVQELARTLVTAEEHKALQQRHAECWLVWAEEFRRKWCWTRDEAAQVQRLKQDRENLFDALRFWEHDAPEKALQLAGALMRFWYVAGLWREGLTWTDRLLAQCPDVEPFLAMRGLNSAGNLVRCLGNYPKSVAYHEACLALSRQEQNDYYTTASLHNLALIAWDLGELDRAEALLAELLPRRMAEGDRMGIALSRTLQSGVLQARGQFEEAEAIVQEALTLFEAEGNPWGIVCGLNFAAGLELARGRPTEALQQQEAALALATRTDDDSGRAYGLTGLGDILSALGRTDDARSAYHRAHEIAQRLGEPGLVARCHKGLVTLA